ncbi:hypothetical protein SD960_08130 [Flavobacterium sp. MMLR14_040]|uniref:hypothetical protein n=1 Tax=Flavobacterium sp. MMLR14_040 TaxID=3093843 RepID=UPI00299021D7|nr:hypothetical protein [Flavobacterium sp. MMLR14_040]MDW8850055.1 hypothetical protein [Flavobacterium sp. MMLR14_040]
MLKEKIKIEEVVFVKKAFNKSLWKSIIVMPFILTFLFLPFYFLLFFIGLFIFHGHLDNLLSLYIYSILGVVIVNFLYGKIIINKRITNKKIYKITEDFSIQRKNSYTHTSEYESDSHYFRLYLINKDDQKKGIYISEVDYKKVKEYEVITITYFETVNIIIKAVCNNQELKYARFFTIRNWNFW